MTTSLAHWLSAFAVSSLLVLGCDKSKDAPAPAPMEAPKAPEAAPAAPKAEEPKAEAAAPAAPAATGKGTASISGEVTLDGAAPEMQPLKRGMDPICGKQQMNDEQVLAKDGKIQNVVVWVSAGMADATPPTTAAKLDQTECMYRPRVQAVVAGQTLEIHNGDGTLHNVRTARDGKTLFNSAQPPKSAALSKTFPAGGGVVSFKCDVHPWMKGFVAVVPHSFFAVTGADGRFTIPELPAGKYTVSAWHELFGTKTAEVTVADGAEAKQTFTFKAADRG
jgi:plastocyanin